jgi:hypothetical protein
MPCLLPERIFPSMLEKLCFAILAVCVCGRCWESMATSIVRERTLSPWASGEKHGCPAACKNYGDKPFESSPASMHERQPLPSRRRYIQIQTDIHRDIRHISMHRSAQYPSSPFSCSNTCHIVPWLMCPWLSRFLLAPPERRSAVGSDDSMTGLQQEAWIVRLAEEAATLIELGFLAEQEVDAGRESAVKCCIMLHTSPQIFSNMFYHVLPIAIQLFRSLKRVALLLVRSWKPCQTICAIQHDFDY